MQKVKGFWKEVDSARNSVFFFLEKKTNLRGSAIPVDIMSTQEWGNVPDKSMSLTEGEFSTWYIKLRYKTDTKLSFDEHANNKQATSNYNSAHEFTAHLTTSLEK